MTKLSIIIPEQNQKSVQVRDETRQDKTRRHTVHSNEYFMHENFNEPAVIVHISTARPVIGARLEEGFSW